jgi:hypothetical protein
MVRSLGVLTENQWVEWVIQEYPRRNMIRFIPDPQAHVHFIRLLARRHANIAWVYVERMWKVDEEVAFWATKLFLKTNVPCFTDERQGSVNIPLYREVATANPKFCEAKMACLAQIEKRLKPGYRLPFMSDGRTWKEHWMSGEVWR